MVKKSPISRANIVHFETINCIKMLVKECLSAIALIQNDTPTSKMKPLLDKRNPLINV